MHAQLVGVIFLFFLGLFVGYLFAADVVAVVINGIIIYLILLRAYAELKAGRERHYMIGAFIALILSLMIQTPFLWSITLFVVIAFLFAQLLEYVSKKS